MKRRALAPADSLDLLLDTMCNTFGGIILIALLVALLARQTPQQSPVNPSLALFEQRIALAESELATLRSHLTQQSDEPVSISAEAVRLAEKQLAAARADAIALASKTTRQAESAAATGGAAWSQLAEELRSLERRETELRNLIAGIEAETARLREREAALAAQLQSERDHQTVKLRFPKERPRTHSSLAVICKYNRLYPLFTSPGELDRTSITWRSVGGDSEESNPKPTSGLQMPLDMTNWRRLLEAFRAEGVYVAFYVYPDSYDVFRAAKEAATESKYEFGIEVVPAGRSLTWGSKGSSPPPL